MVGAGTPPAPLDGLSVADLSDSVAGQFAARLLADHGAAVTLVERSPGVGDQAAGAVRGRPTALRLTAVLAPVGGKSSCCSELDPLVAAAELSAAGRRPFDVLVVSDHDTAGRALERASRR